MLFEKIDTLKRIHDVWIYSGIFLEEITEMKNRLIISRSEGLGEEEVVVAING